MKLEDEEKRLSEDSKQKVLGHHFKYLNEPFLPMTGAL